MRENRRKIGLNIGISVIICGILGLMYPFVGEWVNNRRHNAVVNEYVSEAVELEDNETEILIQEAIDYNKSLYERGGVIKELTDEEQNEYETKLSESETGVMGYINIPKINVLLPIYHGTSEAVLQMGIGHLEGSSLPVGGESTHSVLTGHSGLPSSTLFTDLDELEEGDRFTITVLKRSITYEVSSVEVKLPEDVNLTIEENRDECTLITCTPIGANTHRLLIHANRVIDKK